MDIQTWLETFIHSWVNHDIDAVLSLFSSDVEYWETPFVRLESYTRLAGEWQGMRNQTEITVDTEIVAAQDATHCVQWKLRYKNSQGENQAWAGMYIIRLDSTGLCTYFYQVGEKQNI